MLELGGLHHRVCFNWGLFLDMLICKVCKDCTRFIWGVHLWHFPPDKLCTSGSSYKEVTPSYHPDCVWLVVLEPEKKASVSGGSARTGWSLSIDSEIENRSGPGLALDWSQPGTGLVPAAQSQVQAMWPLRSIAPHSKQVLP